MALIVETGSGSSTADAYVSVSFVDDYATKWGYTSWTGTDAAKEAAIRRATQYLDVNFTFVGSRVSASQALAWPRSGARDSSEGIDIDSTIVPTAVKNACAELAVKSLSGTILLPDLDHGGAVKSEQVGPISVTYQDRAPNSTTYMITGLLKGLIRPQEAVYAPTIYSPQYDGDKFFQPDQFNNTGDVESPGGGT